MGEKAEFIRIPVAPDSVIPQTMPTEPERRIPSSDIYITLCEEADTYKIAEGIYKSFPEAWWSKREPPELRPPHQSTRQKRVADRIRPSFSNPKMHWVKAVYVPTNEIIGIAGWMGPGNPAHCIWRKSAWDFYGWQDQFGVSDEEFEEMWKGVNSDVWDENLAKADGIRQELMGEEPHWYLAPLFTWPEYQGRGVAKLLLQWAIEKADATNPVTPLYLESMPYARAVYMHAGFVPQGESNFIRRGPAVVRGLEAEDEVNKSEGLKGEKVDVEVVATEAEAQLAS